MSYFIIIIIISPQNHPPLSIGLPFLLPHFSFCKSLKVHTAILMISSSFRTTRESRAIKENNCVIRLTSILAVMNHYLSFSWMRSALEFNSSIGIGRSWLRMPCRYPCFARVGGLSVGTVRCLAKPAPASVKKEILNFMHCNKIIISL